MKESEKKALVEGAGICRRRTGLGPSRSPACGGRDRQEPRPARLLSSSCPSHLSQRRDRGIYIREVAGGHQMISKPDYAHWIRVLNQDRKAARLSRAALEVLAIVAYRQPITQPEITEVRGIKSDAPLKTLLGRKLLRIQGRKSVVGRPMLYGTTREFLMQFGLRDLKDLARYGRV